MNIRTGSDRDRPRNSALLSELLIPMQKNCSKCGKDFQCGATREAANGSEELSCWCAELPHVGVVADEDKDCLCPECLPEAIGKLTEKQSEALSETKLQI